MVTTPTGSDRPYRYSGDINFDVPGITGLPQAGYVTGGAHRGSAPYGTYPIQSFTPHTPNGLQGFALNTPGGDMYDPKLGATRSSIMLHLATYGNTLDQLRSSGCLVVPPSQWAALRDSIKSLQQQGMNLVAVLDPNGQVTIRPADGTGTAVSPQEFIAQSSLLKSGATGSNISDVQQFLGAKGFDPGNSDGQFGPQTANAVKAFQTANNLPADGIIGPQTMNALTASGFKSGTPSAPTMIADAGPTPLAFAPQQAPATTGQPLAFVPTQSPTWGDNAATSANRQIGNTDFADASQAPQGNGISLPQLPAPSPTQTASATGIAGLPEPSKVPPGPFGADRLVTAAASGDPATLKSAMDSVGMGVYNAVTKGGQTLSAVKTTLANYLDQVTTQAPGAVRAVQTALNANPDLKTIVAPFKTELNTAFDKLPQLPAPSTAPVASTPTAVLMPSLLPPAMTAKPDYSSWAPSTSTATPTDYSSLTPTSPSGGNAVANAVQQAGNVLGSVGSWFSGSPQAPSSSAHLSYGSPPPSSFSSAPLSYGTSPPSSFHTAAPLAQWNPEVKTVNEGVPISEIAQRSWSTVTAPFSSSRTTPVASRTPDYSQSPYVPSSSFSSPSSRTPDYSQSPYVPSSSFSAATQTPDQYQQATGLNTYGAAAPTPANAPVDVATPSTFAPADYNQLQSMIGPSVPTMPGLSMGLNAPQIAQPVPIVPTVLPPKVVATPDQYQLATGAIQRATPSQSHNTYTTPSGHSYDVTPNSFHGSYVVSPQGTIMSPSEYVNSMSGSGGYGKRGGRINLTPYKSVHSR